jgi:2-isopropylmalate synthase
MARITVFDTTLRDGEQSLGATLTTAEKLRMAHEIADLGVDVIEAGFAASSPDDAASIRQIGAEVSGVVIAALACATRRDIEAAAHVLERTQQGRIHTFIATSAIHLDRKLEISREECLERVGEAVTYARTLMDDVEFSAEDATRTDLDFLCEVVEVAVSAGATTINLPDTVGYALPSEISRMFGTLLARVPGLEDQVLSAHCHDDLGLAVANSLAAVAAGARQVECTVNGIGERAGNAALEEIVMGVHVRADALGHDTGIKTERLYRTSRLLAYLTGIEPQPNKAIIGRNAFAHEASIHQHGMLNDPETYEIMTPELVGAPGTELVLGKHSGRHGIEARYEALGYTLSNEDLDRVTEDVKALAERKKSVLDEDLISVLHHGIMEDVKEAFRLTSLEVHCGGDVSQASVVIETDNDLHLEASGSGDGPIMAALAAMESVLDFRVVLDDLTVRSATPGRDAVGEVSIHARIDAHTFTGRGAHTDVVHAAAQAYLHAVNKAAASRVLEEAHLESTANQWGV